MEFLSLKPGESQTLLSSFSAERISIAGEPGLRAGVIIELFNLKGEKQNTKRVLFNHFTSPMHYQRTNLEFRILAIADEIKITNDSHTEILITYTK